MNDKQKCPQSISIMEDLIGASHMALLRLDDALDTAGLSAAKMWALKQLIEANDLMGVTQLADCMGSNKSNATQMIDRLEADGLVRRVHNPEDRRSILIEVTEEGHARYHAGDPVRERIADQLLCALSAEELECFAQSIRKIHQSLA